jgi:hypothetical protein
LYEIDRDGWLYELDEWGLTRVNSSICEKSKGATKIVDGEFIEIQGSDGILGVRVVDKGGYSISVVSRDEEWVLETDR